MEVSPNLRTQLLLSRTVDLNDIIAFGYQCFIDKIIVGTERSEDDDGLAQSINQTQRFLQLHIAQVMQALVLVIHEARGDLPTLRDICYRQLSNDAPGSRFARPSRQIGERLLEHFTIAARLFSCHIDQDLVDNGFFDTDVLCRKANTVRLEQVDELLPTILAEHCLVLEYPLLQYLLLPQC